MCFSLQELSIGVTEPNPNREEGSDLCDIELMTYLDVDLTRLIKLLSGKFLNSQTLMLYDIGEINLKINFLRPIISLNSLFFKNNYLKFTY